MPKRFNNLKSALKLLRPLSGEGQAADLPDTTALGFFQAVQAGKKQVEYGDRPEGSEPGVLISYALTPFATPVNDAPKVKVSISKRSETNIATAGVTADDLNISKADTDISAAIEIYRFIPARATIRVVTNQTTTSKTSKLTGRKYKTKGGSSYTYAFGFKAGETAKGYKDVKSVIATKVKSATKSVSFTPERYA